ncbi:hypothetical protein BX600DRAFT_445877 [Xylariales sp. PMI_506]|nr:hypothetical protein BX600DRAFT_445877 [Xylariales sp. PMI_506]
MFHIDLIPTMLVFDISFSQSSTCIISCQSTLVQNYPANQLTQVALLTCLLRNSHFHSALTHKVMLPRDTLGLVAFATAASAACIPSGTCGALATVASQINACTSLAPFCYSVLSLPVQTVTETAYVTPAVDVVTVSTTLVEPTTFVETVTITIDIDQTVTETQTAVVTDIITSLDTVIYTTTNTDTITTLVTDTITDIFVDTITTTIDLVKRTASALSTATSGSCLATISPLDITNACSCLSLATSTTVVTVISTLPDNTVTVYATATEVVPVQSTLTVDSTVTVSIHQTSTVTSTDTVTAVVTVPETVTAISTIDIVDTALVTTTTTSIAYATVTNPIANPTFEVQGHFTYESWTIVTTNSGVAGSGASGDNTDYCLLIENVGTSTSTVTISQTISVLAGSTYQFSFSFLVSNQNSANTFTCSFGSSSLPAIVFSDYSTNTWETYNEEVTMNSNSVLFSCEFSAPASASIGVDNFMLSIIN